MAVKAEIFTVRGAGPGKLSTMARPRGGDWLVEEMTALRRAGVDILVSMLMPLEAHELDLVDEAVAAQASGLVFVALPTPDGGVPEMAPFRALVDLLSEELEHGKHIVVHCRGGIGRSSTVAAAVIMAKGLPEDAAWAALREARGLEVPETSQQKDWARVAVARGTP